MDDLDHALDDPDDSTMDVTDENHQEEDSDHELGCCFPDSCICVGIHMRCECWTVDMIERYEESLNHPTTEPATVE